MRPPVWCQSKLSSPRQNTWSCSNCLQPLPGPEAHECPLTPAEGAELKRNLGKKKDHESA